MIFAESLKNRALAVDTRRRAASHGRVIMFSNNPVYRWPNHPAFDMLLKAIVY
jgi:hypothetical protein